MKHTSCCLISFLKLGCNRVTVSRMALMKWGDTAASLLQRPFCGGSSWPSPHSSMLLMWLGPLAKLLNKFNPFQHNKSPVKSPIKTSKQTKNSSAPLELLLSPPYGYF